MNKNKKYSKYFNSKITWIDRIPAHWELYRLRFVFKITKRIVGEDGYDVLSITQQGIKIKDIVSGGGQLSMDYSKYQLVERGDFAMNHMDLLTGFVDISKYDGVMSPDYRVFKLIHEKCNKEYLLYVLQTGYAQKIFFGHGKGVSMLGRWRLPSENFKNYVIPIPPLGEQNKIVDFLKLKLRKIERFILKKKELIKLLNEKKAVIINNVITKGINPDVKMKNSGVKWVGNIPAHWTVKRLKFVAKICNGSDCDKRPEGNYPVYGSGGIFGWNEKFLYDKPSVLLGRKGTVDKPILVIEPFWTVDTAFYTKIKTEEVDVLFFYYLCTNIPFGYYSSKTALPSMTQTSLYQVRFPIPPMLEQVAIVSHIEKETAILKKAISTIEKEISLTQEFKTVLISEAVTGKIDVRDFDFSKAMQDETFEELEKELNLDSESELEYDKQEMD